jgi:hypothetical protein
MGSTPQVAIPGFSQALRPRRRNAGPRGALDALVAERNRRAHGEGPRNEAEARLRIDEIHPRLLEAIEGLAFLGELTWMLPRKISFDDDTKEFLIIGFSLTGDHPSLEPAEILTSLPMAEATIYMEDSDGGRISLSPFCSVSDCEVCFRRGVFYPSRLRDDQLQLISFDCGHSFLDDRMSSQIAGLFQGRPPAEAAETFGEAAPTDEKARSRHWDWEDYERYSSHNPGKLRIVRQISERIESATGWQPLRTKNQIIFKKNGDSLISIQFWAQVPRIFLDRVKDRPPKDPLPRLPGRAIGGGWVWDVPDENLVPSDIGPLISLAEEGYDSPVDQLPPLRADADLFEGGMLSAYDVLKNFDYQATRFLMMIRERGGLRTAKDLLAPHDQHSYGFLKLVEIGKLEWSVEAYALRPEFRGLFEPQELEEARRRLKAADFDVDRWEEKPWT